jgi:alpha 1,6-mannosyltransferase
MLTVQTIPVRPIEEWGTHNVEYLDISFTDGPSWRSSLSARPSVVVGVDVDVHAHPSWIENGWPRPLGICQWALSSAPHHPIMLDAVRRVVNATHVVADWEADRDRQVERLRAEGREDEAREMEEMGDVEAMSVMEWTGPGL